MEGGWRGGGWGDPSAAYEWVPLKFPGIIGGKKEEDGNTGSAVPWIGAKWVSLFY